MIELKITSSGRRRRWDRAPRHCDSRTPPASPWSPRRAQPVRHPVQGVSDEAEPAAAHGLDEARPAGIVLQHDPQLADRLRRRRALSATGTERQTEASSSSLVTRWPGRSARWRSTSRVFGLGQCTGSWKRHTRWAARSGGNGPKRTGFVTARDRLIAPRVAQGQSPRSEHHATPASALEPGVLAAVDLDELAETGAPLARRVVAGSAAPWDQPSAVPSTPAASRRTGRGRALP